MRLVPAFKGRAKFIPTLRVEDTSQSFLNYMTQPQQFS